MMIERWKMPGWMEKYRDCICNTGGNSVEELANNHSADIETNAPLALICVAVKTQIGLLITLHNKGLLKD